MVSLLLSFLLENSFCYLLSSFFWLCFIPHALCLITTEIYLACLVSPLFCISPFPRLHLILASPSLSRTGAVLVFSSALSGVSATSLPAPYASPSSSPWLSSFFGPPFTKTGNIPTLEEVLSAVLGHGFEFPLLTESPSVTQKGAQQISFQLPESKSPQEDSLFLSRTSPLLPSHTQIIYPNIFPWEKTSQPEPYDFQKAIADYLAVATRNASRKLVLLHAARVCAKISCWQDLHLCCQNANATVGQLRAHQ